MNINEEIQKSMELIREYCKEIVRLQKELRELLGAKE